MIKLFQLVVVAAVLAGVSGIAGAQTVSAPFTVSVTLTPTCTVKTAATNIDFGTYTAFQSADIDKTSSVTYQCTSGILPTSVGFSSSAGGTTVAAPGTGAATAEGVLNGLRYTLATGSGFTATAPTTPTTAATAGSGGTGGTNSTGNQYAFSINAKIPSGQGGAGTGAVASHNWNLLLVY